MIINGKELEKNLDMETRENLSRYDFTRPAKLAIVLVGNNPESLRYIKRKIKKCEKFGIQVEVTNVEENAEFHAVKRMINELNSDAGVDGILLQMPLPKAFVEKNAANGADVARLLVEEISPDKDVDGLTSQNIGKYVLGDKNGFVPATPLAVMRIITDLGYDIAGKHAVIINRSLIVGKPLAMLLLNHNATVTIVHSYTQDITAFTKQADIVISAVGKENFLTKEMIKPGAVVIDVGITVTPENTLVGDIDFEHVQDSVLHITPVPGGVGPLTVSFIIANVLKAYIHHNGKKKDNIS